MFLKPRSVFMQRILVIALLCILWNFSLQGKSISENNLYLEACRQAVEDSSTFSHFKRNPGYLSFMDVPSYELGEKYLKLIHKEYPELLHHFNKFRQNDALGDPITYDFGEDGHFSPTTLRYIKVAGDLKHHFGDLSQMHIVEIGGGYGGQCKILADLGGFASYTIVDLPEANALANKYLTSFGVQNVNFINRQDLDQVPPADLIISNFAFSEIDKQEQLDYLEQIILPAPNGYMTFNFITSHFNLESFPIEDVVSQLYCKGKKGVLETETPCSHRDNLVLRWKSLNTMSSKANTGKTLRESNSPQKNNAIGYTLGGGRFGDNLVSYFHARWLSFKYGLPFLYRPFQYSDKFCMDRMDPRLGSPSFKFRHNIKVIKEHDINITPSSTLFVVDYFPECKLEFELFDWSTRPYFPVDWEDLEFRKEIARCLTPKKPVSSLNLPPNCITVAVHVRRGGGVDPEATGLLVPLKFPPDSYYIEQIRRVANIFKNQFLYVYIMTDDLNPSKIAKNYARVINNSWIKFDCRLKGNSPHSNVIEDFLSLTKFDCLIRCQSNFSLMASNLGNYKLLITPLHAYIKEKEIIIDHVELVFKGK